MAPRAKKPRREEGEEDAQGVKDETDTNGESPSINSSKKKISLAADIDLLDCIICFLPLRPPLFQCRNGHVVCPSCCDKLQNKCPTSSLYLKYGRCIALEKLIESIRVSCSNNGCNKMISYTDLRKHEQDTCVYVPCFCPIPNCSFSGSIDLLSAHVDNCHKEFVKYMISDRYDLVRIERNKPFCVIRAVNHKELFLLVNHAVSAGNALSMTCIGPQTSEYSFAYELRLYDDEKGSSLQMEAPMTISPRKWVASSYSTDLFLLVPPKFHVFGLIMDAVIDIKKKIATSEAKQSTM